MDTGTKLIGGHGSDINDEISNRPKEVLTYKKIREMISERKRGKYVLVGPPVDTVTIGSNSPDDVWIRVYDFLS